MELKKIEFSWKTIFAISLIIFILFGLSAKAIQSANMSLTSDMSGEGLESMEIWAHQNYFLGGYYLPSQDTFLFTELLPFQLIPQILTGYSPLALKIMVFVEFVLGTAILSYIVYLISESLMSALLFAALAMNLPPEGYYYFALPTSHMGTIVFLGIIFALLIYMSKKEEELTHRNRKGKVIHSTKIQWAYILGLLILVALTVVSDTIILPWLIVPYIIVYLLFIKEKSKTMNIAIVSMAIVSVIVYIFKTYFVPNWVVQDVFASGTTTDIVSKIVLYFQDLAVLLNQGLSSVSQGFAGFGILEALSLLAFCALLAYAIKNVLEDRKRWLFFGVLLASGITMFAMWLVSDYSVDSSSARYITFTAFTVLMLIAIGYREGNKVFGALIIAVLLISATYGVIQLGEQQQPNANYYGLISYLKENNLTFGYGDFMDSNAITYLSGEGVTVRSASYYTNTIQPYVWLSCDRWYQSTPDNSFILVDNSSLDDTGRSVVKSLTASLNASGPLHYGQYDIYPLENFHIGSFQVQR
jgi:hypothetical protein